MSQTESYEPHGRHKVWSPWAKTAKEGTKNGSRESIGKQIVGNGIPTVKETQQEKKPTLAEVSAARALHRKAEKQARTDLTRRWPAETIKPRASKPYADFLAAQTSPTIRKTTLESPLPQTHLRTRTKVVTNATAVAKTDTEMSFTVPDHKWTCTACSREMLKSQQQYHLAGKAHINRLKLTSSASASAPSNPPLQPATAQKDSPRIVTTTTTRTQKAKPKTAKTTQRGHPRSAGSKDRKLRDRAAGTPSFRTNEPPAHPNWGFIGFGQSSFATNYAYDEYYSEKGDDFGICDKDCGWCGHCMDNIDI